MADNQFIATYGSTNQAQAAADDPYYAQWQYYQSTLDRGNVSGGVLDEPEGTLWDAPVTTTSTATVNADGSVAPAGAQSPAADPASWLNPGLMGDLMAGGSKPPAATRLSLVKIGLLALVAWLVWRAVK